MRGDVITWDESEWEIVGEQAGWFSEGYWIAIPNLPAVERAPIRQR